MEGYRMDRPQTIVCDRRTYSAIGCTHEHVFAQLILPLSGALFIQTQTHHLELDESAIFFLPAGCSHYFYARQNNEFLTLDIPQYLIAPLTASPTAQKTEGSNNPESICFERDERWTAIRTLLLAEASASSKAGGTFLPLVSYISGLLTQPRSSPSLQHIHDHYHSPLTVTHLAQIEGYTLSYYGEWFKAQTGKTPKAYIQDLRIQQAKKLLQHSDLPVREIAQQVGFASASSLTRLFQQRDRQTPSRYRLARAANKDPKPGEFIAGI